MQRYLNSDVLAERSQELFAQSPYMMALLDISKRLNDEIKHCCAYDKIKNTLSELVDYLKCFDMPGKLLQTKECISYACEQLLRELYQDHVMLAEVRFAPQLHKKRGLTGEEIVNAAISGMNKALVDCPEMKAGLILCMMIGGEEAENLETVELAESFLGKGVIALDIAGAEGMEPAEKFVPMFQRAKELGIPFTIHAGECGSYDHINLAMDLGASRIGHGVAAIYSEETMERLVRE